MDTQRRALVIVDVQNDFCEGGSLAVAGGSVVAQEIGRHVVTRRDDYDHVVATADWHLDPGEHFAPAPDYGTTVLLDLTAGVARATTEAALLELRTAGLRLQGAPVVID